MSKRQQRCVLCDCPAVGEVYGFPVCEYHKTHGEADPPCPDHESLLCGCGEPTCLGQCGSPVAE